MSGPADQSQDRLLCRLPLFCPLSSIILACGCLEGCPGAISYGCISDTYLSLKKACKDIFTEGPRRQQREMPGKALPGPHPFSPRAPLPSATPLQSPILSALFLSSPTPSLRPLTPPLGLIPSCGTVRPALGCLYTTQALYVTELAWRSLPFQKVEGGEGWAER